MPNINKLTDEQKAWLNQSAPAMGTRGSTDPARLSFGDIIAALITPGGGNVIQHTFNAVANTQDAIPHGLPYTPTGYIVIGKSVACDVFTGQAADANDVYLKCTVASAAVTLIVF